jgi:lysozyme
MEQMRMTPDARQRLKQMLLRDEKYEQYPYVDSTGHLTIAIGQNISPTGDGISLPAALFMVDEKISTLNDKFCHFFPWFLKLNDARQIVLLNMAFNLGFEGFLKFHEVILALQGGHVEDAAIHMLDSKWADETGDRATRLANIMRTGEI